MFPIVLVPNHKEVSMPKVNLFPFKGFYFGKVKFLTFIIMYTEMND